MPLRLILVAGVSAASIGSAAAQTSLLTSPQISPVISPWPKDAVDSDPAETAEGAEAARPESAKAPEAAKTPEAAKAPEISDVDIDKLDWSQLNMDSVTLTNPPAKKAAPSKTATSKSTSPDLSWSSQDKPNGSSAVTVKQPLSTYLDAKIGADMNVVRQPTLTASDQLSQKLANGGSLPQSSGSAWATLTTPGVASLWDKTSVEARIDPSQDQSKLGTSLSKSLPLNEQYSVTLQNGYNVIEQNALPVPGLPGRSLRNYETEQSAKLSIAQTGTSFTAGQTLSTTDDKWLRKVGAEQKLFGGVSINGSIGETPLGAANKSLTAGFKQSW